MGFTPTAGLMMGTRSGDLDPGLLVSLMRNERLSPDQLDDLVNRRSGLLGVSETSPDMRDLLARQADDPRAHAV
jgi:acetate kinase